MPDRKPKRRPSKAPQFIPWKDFDIDPPPQDLLKEPVPEGHEDIKDHLVELSLSLIEQKSTDESHGRVEKHETPFG